MATDNKAVTAYLPDDIEKSLTKYCTSKGFIRKDKSGKDKPSLGTGIVEILKDYFGVTSLDNSDLSRQLEACFGDKVKDLVQQLVSKELNIRLGQQIDTPNLLLDLGDVEQTVMGEYLAQNYPRADLLVTKEVKDSVQGSVHETLFPYQAEIIPTPKTILFDTKTLAIRLGLSSSKISHQKTTLSNAGFLTWLKERDPDNLEWNFKEKTQGKGVYYFPITDPVPEAVMSDLIALQRKI